MNQVRYGAFSLSVLVTYSGGNYILDRGEHLQSYVRAPGNNVRQDVVDGAANLYYSGPYQSGGVTKYYTDPLSARPTDRFLTKGDYINFKNIVLDYTLPTSVVRSLRVQGGRVFIQLQDIYQISPYKNGSREFAGNLQSPLARNMGQGVSYFNLPQLATYMAGINVTF